MAYKFQKVDNIDIEQDPVRPELSLAFRNSKTRGREIYALVNDKGEYASIVCIAHCKFIPKSVDELKKFSDPTGNIAIAYTVWSHTKGAGKTIIDHLLKMARDSKQTKRVVTLSPLTLMAKNFHEKNGAVRIGLNPETQNFEYSLKDTRWEKYMKDAKKWFGLHVG
jgi:hypothetical protein